MFIPKLRDPIAVRTSYSSSSFETPLPPRYMDDSSSDEEEDEAQKEVDCRGALAELLASSNKQRPSKQSRAKSFDKPEYEIQPYSKEEEEVDPLTDFPDLDENSEELMFYLMEKARIEEEMMSDLTLIK